MHISTLQLGQRRQHASLHAHLCNTVLQLAARQCLGHAISNHVGSGAELEGNLHSQSAFTCKVILNVDVLSALRSEGVPDECKTCLIVREDAHRSMHHAELTQKHA
jgi:hypothetical protein